MIHFFQVPNIALERIVYVGILIPQPYNSYHSKLDICLEKLWLQCLAALCKVFPSFWNDQTTSTMRDLGRRKRRSNFPSELRIVCTGQHRRDFYEYCAGKASFRCMASKKVIISFIQVGLWKWALGEILSWWPVPRCHFCVLRPPVCHNPPFPCRYTALTHVGCSP